MRYKLLFHISALLLIATEAYRTFLLIPLPGSQEIQATDTTYFLYHYRWIIRIVLFAGMLIGYRKVFEKRVWIPMITLFFAGWIFYLANFEMTAETFFHSPSVVAFTDPGAAKIPMDALVIGVTNNGESKAYPIRYLSFHHQVMDSVGGMPVLVTYCDVCRSGIAYLPNVNYEPTTFRLVGMDRFNAMFEDRLTGSWWMQANGECVAGEAKGETLFPVYTEQLTLGEWSQRHPGGKVMLPDPLYAAEYGDEKFDKGTNTDALTGRDTASWQDKSWVIGVELNGCYRAYDWTELTSKRNISDTLGGKDIVVMIDDDNMNFHADEVKLPPLPSDSLETTNGMPVEFIPVPARQMFWHTWRTFYPATTRYGVK